MKFTIEGNLLFDPINISKKHHSQSSWKKVAMVVFKGDIHAYYAWFLEKRFSLVLNPPVRGAHVTIISDKIDNDTYEQAFKLFDGKTISFDYEPAEIRTNGKHWWLKVYSTDSQNIRRALGLTPDPYMALHLTLGYANSKNEEHSEYIAECIKRHGI